MSGIKGQKWSESAKKRIRGKRNHQWKGGRFVDDKGYVRLYLPEHPRAFGKGYVYEHRYVMEQYLERGLLREEKVHHINGNKQDNRIENLMLFPNQKAHLAFRHLNRKMFICKHCGKSQLEKE